MGDHESNGQHQPTQQEMHLQDQIDNLQGYLQQLVNSGKLLSPVSRQEVVVTSQPAQPSSGVDETSFGDVETASPLPMTAAAKSAAKPEPKVAIPYLEPKVADPSQIDWKTGSQVKPRYVQLHGIMTELINFQKEYLPDNPDPDMVQKFNGIIDKVRTEMKNHRIAESSEYGWSTVIQYASTPVGDDEADMKKIRMAEGMAAKKAKKTFNNLKRPFRSGGGGQYNRPAPQNSQNIPSLLGPIFQAAAAYGNGYASGPSFQQRNTTHYKKSDGPPKCYGCGEVGHIRPNCPNGATGK